MRIGGLIVAICVLAGCNSRIDVTAVANHPVPVGDADTCGAGPYGGLVGQDVTALERVLILRQIRIIRPDDPVTTDLRPARINFMIKADETIEAITCG